jgi:hypothetical protein
VIRRRGLLRWGRSGLELILAVRVVLKVVLVFGLGLPEHAGLADPGNDRTWPDVSGVNVGDCDLCNVALVLVRSEDLRAVVRANTILAEVGPVDLEEELQDRAVGGLFGIEDNLDSLSVARMVVTGRVIILASGVADAAVSVSSRIDRLLLDVHAALSPLERLPRILSQQLGNHMPSQRSDPVFSLGF